MGSVSKERQEIYDAYLTGLEGFKQVIREMGAKGLNEGEIVGDFMEIFADGDPFSLPPITSKGLAVGVVAMIELVKLEDGA